MIRGSVAVVTGGASGIGRAVVDRLQDLGATPVVWDRDPSSTIPCDVADADSVERALDETIARFGTPGILVAAAGIGHRGTLLDTGWEDWDRVFAVNVRGVFLTIKAVGRAMSGRDGGSIVVLSSVNGQLADPGLAAYSASKAAVAHLARTAAVELGPHGIRVNAISPGPTATPMLGAALDSADYSRDVAAVTPLGRLGRPEDVAVAITSVIKAEWITGQVIAADGGASLATARGFRSNRSAEPAVRPSEGPEW